MTIPVNELLAVVVSFLVIFSFGSLFLTSMHFIAPLVERLVSPSFYHWTREIDRHDVGLTVPLVYAPLLSGVVAVLAGVGVNIITTYDDTTASFWIGMLLVCAGLAGLAGGGAWLLHTLRAPRPWLAKVRWYLRQSIEQEKLSPDVSSTLMHVQRIRRVGERLVQRGDNLTMRRWVRMKSSEARSVGQLTIFNLIALIVIALAAPYIETDPPPPAPIWYFAIALAVVLPAGPVGLVISRNHYRWWCRRLGRELIDEAEQVEESLRRSISSRTPVLRTIRALMYSLWMQLWRRVFMRR